MSACSSGHLNIAQLLHKHGALLTAVDDRGDNALHYAVNNGRDAVVAWLLSERMPVDEVKLDGITPLMYACSRGNLGTAQLLRKHGAWLAAVDNQGNNVLHHAANNGHEAVVAWLLSERMPVDEVTLIGMTPLMYACRNGNLGTAQLLHALGAQLTAVDNQGYNVLHYAAISGHDAVVAWLLSERMSVDGVTLTGMTPLICACSSGHLKIAQLLHEHGVLLTAVDGRGKNVLHHAAENGHEAVVVWLLGERIPVDGVTLGGITPLMYACRNGKLGTAQLLREHGALLTAVDRRGHNLLHYAASTGRKAVVAWLLDQGVPVDPYDNAAETPLSMALDISHWGVVAMLIARGANLDRLYEDSQRIGKVIFTKAEKHSRYEVLLSLIGSEWLLPATVDDLLSVDSSDDSSSDSSDEEDPVRAIARTRFAVVHDLDHVFRGRAAQRIDAAEYEFLDPEWLSPEKRSDRQQFIEAYLNDMLMVDGKAANVPDIELRISSHPLFSHVIHDQLKYHKSDFSELLQALAGTVRPIPSSYQQKLVWFKLQALRRTSQITQPFQGKHLPPAAESVICKAVTRQLEVLLLGVKEYFLNKLADFPEVLKALCRKYIRMSGDFDAASFNKALIKQGIYAVNANRLTKLISGGWEEVSRKPLDLTGIATVGQVFSLSAPQVIESLFNQTKKAVLADSEEWIVPGFAQGLAMLEQDDQDMYADEIFGQWREMWRAMGVTLPKEVTLSQ